MSTRSLFSFLDPAQGGVPEIYHVYMHMDGYPAGAVDAIKKALPHAWAPPRFEADEFGAAFVAGNKGAAGNVRLLHSGEWKAVAPGDIEYRYEVTGHATKGIMVRGYAVSEHDNEWTESELFYTPLSKFKDMDFKALQAWEKRIPDRPSQYPIAA